MKNNTFAKICFSRYWSKKFQSFQYFGNCQIFLFFRCVFHRVLIYIKAHTSCTSSSAISTSDAESESELLPFKPLPLMSSKSIWFFLAPAHWKYTENWQTVTILKSNYTLTNLHLKFWMITQPAIAFSNSAMEKPKQCSK